MESKQQTECCKCSFYYGRDKIICALHPDGFEDKFCPDWEPVKEKFGADIMSNNDVNLSSNTRTGAILKSVAIVAVVASVGFWVFKLYEGYKIGTKSDAVHQDYVNNCQVILHNAASAGTVGVSLSELEKAENWLKINYNQNSFEYKDLKGDVDYLKQQRSTSIIPTSIVKSIEHSSQLIDETEEQINQAHWLEYCNIVLLTFLLFSLLGFFLIIIVKSQAEAW